jgi:hypothetical protein
MGRDEGARYRVRMKSKIAEDEGNGPFAPVGPAFVVCTGLSDKPKRAA